MTLTTSRASQLHALAAVAGLASGSGPFKLQPLRLYSLLLIHCTRYPYARGLFGLDETRSVQPLERAEAGRRVFRARPGARRDLVGTSVYPSHHVRR